MIKKILTYAWLLPGSFVAYEFADKLLEVLQDPAEFVEIISVLGGPFADHALLLAYGIGMFDCFVALALLAVPLIPATKKYAPAIFSWVVLWPYVPASLRYFGGVAEFEVVPVVTLSLAGLCAYFIYAQGQQTHFTKPSRLWFRAKRFGWGWQPQTWEGWAVLGTWVAVNVCTFLVADFFSHSGSDTLIACAPMFVFSTSALLVCCYAKGEAPWWRWGK
jgi:hypothetical protein